MRYHESKLGDFSATLLLDSHSNQFINLTLKDAKGTIYGLVISLIASFAWPANMLRTQVSGYNSTQAVQVSVRGDRLLENVWRKVKVTGILCRKGQVDISAKIDSFDTISKVSLWLHPAGETSKSGNSGLFKNIPCVEYDLKQFRELDAVYVGDRGEPEMGFYGLKTYENEPFVCFHL